jgi:hypothetical protein
MDGEIKIASQWSRLRHLYGMGIGYTDSDLRFGDFLLKIKNDVFRHTFYRKMWDKMNLKILE